MGKGERKRQKPKDKEEDERRLNNLCPVVGFPVLYLCVETKFEDQT